VARYLRSGDEAGTAPEDRTYRPDVEGLRAVAVVLVVVFHVWWLPLNGGFIGVDVFFVISGFVITGLLLRERSATGRTNILAFYGRRARRIVPAATLVLVATLVATHLLLSPAENRLNDSDVRWASVFLANVHLARAFPVIVYPTRPASSIQHYWSLAVEEQFYLIYPALVVAIAILRPRRWRLEAVLAVVLTAIMIASYSYSVTSTTFNNLGAYYPLTTRACELCVGGLIALGARHLRKIHTSVAAPMTWIGIGGIVAGALLYKLGKPLYPGWAIALPVVSAGLVIAGGTAEPRFGAERLLRLQPFKWLGRWSFSLYLWHLPLIIIAGLYWGGTIHGDLSRNFLLVGIALVLAALTYALVENPIRHSSFLGRSPWISLGLGALLIGGCFGLTYAP
jgi:peptidoglycan/LPS O-acetylase OafA/YrhL